jgi:hypothetical protein
MVIIVLALFMLCRQTNNQYAYLTVFDNRKWKPVAFGKINDRKAYFDKMGRDAVYLPVIMHDDLLKPVAPPFVLDLQGNINPIIADIHNTQTLKLYRKYPAQRYTTYETHRILGGCFEAANRPDFSDAVTIHTIDKYGTESNEISPETNEKYRYWRHLSATGGFGAMAELYFFQNGKLVNKKGKIIGSADGETKFQKKANLFDNDPATFWDAPTKGDYTWAGFDFSVPVDIDRIIYVPRCDGNGVTFGDEYELNYWDNDCWNSLGRKVADNIFVEFDNCPTDALFLLHNVTRGKEERIFTYENGKQVFW